MRIAFQVIRVERLFEPGGVEIEQPFADPRGLFPGVGLTSVDHDSSPRSGSLAHRLEQLVVEFKISTNRPPAELHGLKAGSAEFPGQRPRGFRSLRHQAAGIGHHVFAIKGP